MELIPIGGPELPREDEAARSRRGKTFRTAYISITGFPLRLEKLEGIFLSGKSQGILNSLEKSGKITQNTGKLWEFQTNFICYFSVIFK